MVDPILEMIFNQNDTAPVLVTVALRTMAMTPEPAWPPLDPIPPIFCGRYQKAGDIKNAVWIQMERDLQNDPQVFEKLLSRMHFYESAMLLSRYAINPMRGSEVDQMVHAISVLTESTSLDTRQHVALAFAKKIGAIK